MATHITAVVPALNNTGGVSEGSKNPLAINIPSTKDVIASQEATQNTQYIESGNYSASQLKTKMTSNYARSPRDRTKDGSERRKERESECSPTEKSTQRSHRRSTQSKRTAKLEQAAKIDLVAIGEAAKAAFSLRDDKDFLASQRNIMDHINRLDGKLETQAERYGEVLSRLERLTVDVERQQAVDPQIKIDKLQRKMIEQVVQELLTPLKRNLNVDLKKLRKHIEDLMASMDAQRDKSHSLQQQLDLMNVSILRQLKNTDNEKQLLNRELHRMQDLDRLKVQHARNSFYNPDTGSVLPTVDTMWASQGAATPSVGGFSFD